MLMRAIGILKIFSKFLQIYLYFLFKRAFTTVQVKQFVNIFLRKFRKNKSLEIFRASLLIKIHTFIGIY